jgi:hypothetical protein
MFFITLFLLNATSILGLGLENPCGVASAPYDSSASPDCVLPDASGKFFAH